MIRVGVALGVALLVSLFGTRLLISWLRRVGVGQPIHEDVPEGHTTKKGTPTMGGIAIVAGATVGYVVSHLAPSSIFTRSGLVVMMAIAGAGAVGMLDDWIKVSSERNLGLNKSAKVLGLLAVAVGFAVLSVTWVDVDTVISFTRESAPLADVGELLWGLWAVLLIVGATNAVNLTDGLDGLAAGSGAVCFGAFILICFFAFRNPEVYDIPHALDLAVAAASMAGACFGFLWWNAAPARIFMGDTGSLAIGAGLAGLALTTNTHLLLPLIGGLFVAETLSVILQVGSFRIFGRRIFRMAPIHHHFELAGWPETTVIIRFWILSGICTAVGLGVFYADFVSLDPF